MISFAPFPICGRKTLLLAEGNFSALGSKTAACFLRYREADVTSVVDSTQAGRDVGDILGYGSGIPVLETVDEALDLGPELVIVGVAPRGGSLDDAFKSAIISCVDRGLDVVSGLHTFLDEDSDIASAQTRSVSRIWDVRRVQEPFYVATGKGCATGARTVLIAGTDCNTGKMTCTKEFYVEAKRRGINAAWCATGQTGIMLREKGIAIDRVVSDFIGGAMEELINSEGEGRDLVIVEGQGSIIHPGYAGVAVGLMFGAMPDCIVLTHEAGRNMVRGYDVPIPPMSHVVELHEQLFAPLKRVPVVAISLNTHMLNEGAAVEEVNRLAQETGLPVGDPVRSGSGTLLDAVMGFLSKDG